jgi:hypothetical protein
MWDNVALKCGLVGCLTIAAAACAGSTEEGAASETAISEGMQDGAATEFPEAVQVLSSDNVEFCTGVLVSPTRVLTAGHCMVTGKFTIIAPYAPKTNGEVQSAPGHATAKDDRIENYRDVDKEDVMAIRLDKPIQLASYPELRDVGELEGKPTLPPAIAVGRIRTARTAELMKSRPLTVQSASHRGYLNSVLTQIYSEGGDSGGPLFLIEGKKHVLIGINRDPDGTIDIFSRITPNVRGLLEP